MFESPASPILPINFHLRDSQKKIIYVVYGVPCVNRLGPTCQQCDPHGGSHWSVGSAPHDRSHISAGWVPRVSWWGPHVMYVAGLVCQVSGGSGLSLEGGGVGFCSQNRSICGSHLSVGLN